MIEKSFISTFEEWKEGQTLWCRTESAKAPYLNLSKIISYGFWALGGLCIARKLYWPGFLLLALLSTSQWIISKRRTALYKWSFERDPDRDQQVRVEISDDGYFSIREGLTECRMNWNAFSGWKEGALTVILGRHGKYCFIPKRILAEHELIYLRNLCEQNIIVNQ